MAEFAKEIIPIAIEEELKRSYIDYAMSVIVGRALPDVRDGLKPVHRRVLYAMYELSNDWNKPYKKSARVVGDVIGKYHPHGDAAVYETIVRMAQPFSMRYMLVDGQGNFGSVDGDSPAAMRYTEIRLAKIAHSLLEDLDKETVDFVPNYDGSEFMPLVMPTRVPTLLVNGSSGIAVGMATNIPPHNLSEVIDACVAMVDNPDITLKELFQYIPGPDFPTAGIINGRAGIVQAYRTGRGRIYVRARHTIETDKDSGKESIVIHELPYQVNKARLLEKIGDLVKDKAIEGITAIRDESDKQGMRAVIELRRGESADVIVNQLYTHTQMQVVFGINMVALDQGVPKILNLHEILVAFIQHRRDVVTRRTTFELNKARQRGHILEGLGVALANIDEIVALIRAAKTPAEAKTKLLARKWDAGNIKAMLEKTGAEISRPQDLSQEFGITPQGYQLSEVQAQAILDMRLHRLTGLEQEKIVDEYQQLLKKILELLKILRNPEELMQVIRSEFLEIKDKFGDERRTEIIDAEEHLSIEDLIAEEDVVVTLSHEGYAKIQPLDVYNAQRRGGKGKSITKVKEEDYVEHLLVANTHDTLLCFSNLGKMYWLKVYQLPQGSRGSRGKPIVNLLPLQEQERVTAILPIREFEHGYVFMATAMGTVKKVALNEFSRPRANGIIALELVNDDRLIGVATTQGDQEIMLFASDGKVIRFHEEQVRPMGRNARGVRGIKLGTNQEVRALIVVMPEGAVLTATANGYGKRTNVEDYPAINRGGQGVIGIKVNERNGKVIGAAQVLPDEEIMLISDKGTLVRTRVNEVSVIGRNTQGVKLISVSEEEQLIALQRIECIDEEESEEEVESAESAVESQEEGAAVE